MSSTFGRTFLFLTNLAWKSRVTLPVLITAGFMILNFRWEVEINIHTERIAIQGVDDGRGGRVGGVAVDYSLDETWESTDEDDDEDEDDEDDTDDDGTEYDYTGDEDENEDGYSDELTMLG